MASEDLFRNEYSEEPDLGQDIRKDEEMNIETAEHDTNDVEQATGQNSTNSSPNVDLPAATSPAQTKPSKPTDATIIFTK